MKTLRILYLGGGWITNIGNAFIDLGSIHSLRMACPDIQIYFVSDMPRVIFSIFRANLSNVFDLAGVIKCDHLVLSGAILSAKFIQLNGSVISKLIKKGVKLIINGGGGSTYTEEEIDTVTRFLRKNPPYIFISRDRQTFENYSYLSEYSYDGIDCGFFVSDFFVPAELDLPDFIVLNFDPIGGPFNYLAFLIKHLFDKNKKLFRTSTIDGKLIIRTHHSFIPFMPHRYFREANVLISDNPYDYLNLYAHTKATYSNRVHACVATLAFNNPARLFSNTPRAALLDRVGANTIREKLTYPDIQKIRDEKLNQVKFLSKILVEETS